MPRIATFILLRLLATAWILIALTSLSALGPYSLSLLAAASEAAFGALWGKTESDIRSCRPRREEPAFVLLLIACTALVEAVLFFVIAPPLALSVLLWRALTGYLPFGVAEMVVYSMKCRSKKS
jgi:hypothetical protein